MHILNHRRQFGSVQDTMDLIMTTQNGMAMNCGKSSCTNYQQQNLLTEE